MKYCGLEVSPCGVLIRQLPMTVHSTRDLVGNRPLSRAGHTETNRENGRRLFYVCYQRPRMQTAPSQHSPRARILSANIVASSVLHILVSASESIDFADNCEAYRWTIRIRQFFLHTLLGPLMHKGKSRLLFSNANLASGCNRGKFARFALLGSCAPIAAARSSYA